MRKIVGVVFDDGDKIYHFDSNKLTLDKDDYVIVETERGNQFAKIAVAPYEVDEHDLGKALKKVIRKADDKDRKTYENNLKDADKALLEAKKIAESLKLNMQLIDATYTFDKSQLLFHFLADARIDFRELAKRLANTYKTRIELRQIGVRDKAKMVGGLGPCGRFLCCSTFLTDFNSVSINMAKNQLLALNPTKINGICGRLLCCLGYEDDTYTELKKDMPSIGQIYKKGEYEGKIISLNILRRTVTIETQNKTIIEVQV